MNNEQKPLALGFIGYGRIAQAHLKAAANLPGLVRPVAIAGRRRQGLWHLDRP
jgi:predicted dehydrogenase